MGKIRVVALAVIFNEKGEILLTKRYQPESSYGHGKWQLPGGEVEFGENPIDTMAREVQEEVGIKVEILSPNPIVYNSVHSNHIVLLCYPTKFTTGQVDISGDDESSDFKWFSADTIPYEQTLEGTKLIVDQASQFFV